MLVIKNERSNQYGNLASSLVSLQILKSVEEEVSLVNQLNILTIEFELQMTCVSFNLSLEGFWWMSWHEWFYIIHEVDLVNIQVTEFSLK